MRSPITYYGGKTSMLKYILPLIPADHSVYTEVFFGGGAVFFAKDPVKNETINDKLDIVINFYEQLKNNWKNLNRLINATLLSRSQHDKALLIIRNKELFSPVDKAWAFWMLANFSFGNKIGGGIKYSNEQNILPPQMMKRYKSYATETIVTRIENLHIENRCGVQVLKSRNTKKAFHYIDPPYPDTDQGHYRGYSWSDYEFLLNQLEETNGRFMLSSYNSPLLQEFIDRNHWQLRTFQFKNKGMRKHDREKYEVLVMNYEPVEQKELFEN